MTCIGYQSKYRQLHSPEAALLWGQIDIRKVVDPEGGAISVLLELSAAFDITDHQKLLDLLDYSFWIGGDAMEWFKSHLQDSTQTGSKLSLSHQSLWHWNMGFYLDQTFSIYHVQHST